jgi:hypothetical protein
VSTHAFHRMGGHGLGSSPWQPCSVQRPAQRLGGAGPPSPLRLASSSPQLTRTTRPASTSCAALRCSSTGRPGQGSSRAARSAPAMDIASCSRPCYSRRTTMRPSAATLGRPGERRPSELERQRPIFATSVQRRSSASCHRSTSASPEPRRGHDDRRLLAQRHEARDELRSGLLDRRPAGG